MSQSEEREVLLDEWVYLVKLAKELGLTVADVRHYLQEYHTDLLLA